LQRAQGSNPNFIGSKRSRARQLEGIQLIAPKTTYLPRSVEELWGAHGNSMPGTVLRRRDYVRQRPGNSHGFWEWTQPKGWRRPVFLKCRQTLRLATTPTNCFIRVCVVTVNKTGNYLRFSYRLKESGKFTLNYAGKRPLDSVWDFFGRAAFGTLAPPALLPATFIQKKPWDKKRKSVPHRAAVRFTTALLFSLKSGA